MVVSAVPSNWTMNSRDLSSRVPGANRTVMIWSTTSSGDRSVRLANLASPGCLTRETAVSRAFQKPPGFRVQPNALPLFPDTNPLMKRQICQYWQNIGHAFAIINHSSRLYSIVAAE